MDIRGQATSLWLRRAWILGGALLVAVLALVLSATRADVYEATQTLRIVVVSQTGDASTEDATAYADTVVGLASSDTTVADIVGALDGSLTAEQVGAQLSVTPLSTPGFLEVTAEGPSAAEAEQLANAAGTAIAARLAQDQASAVDTSTEPLDTQLQTLAARLAGLPAGSVQAATVQSQIDILNAAITQLRSAPTPQLVVGAAASAGADPVAPTPLRDAAVAFVLALVVLAEGIILVRAVRGRLSEHAPAEQVREVTGLPAVDLRPGTDPVTAMAKLYRDHLAGVPDVAVLALGRRATPVVAALLARTAALVAGPGSTPTFHPVSCRSLDAQVVDRVQAVARSVVVVVDTADSGIQDVVDVVASVEATGCSVLGVVVWVGSLGSLSGSGPVRSSRRTLRTSSRVTSHVFTVAQAGQGSSVPVPAPLDAVTSHDAPPTEPRPVPAQQQVPAPGSEPVPVPGPAPAPEPGPAPELEPEPVPVPQTGPAPAPEPGAVAEMAPVAELEPVAEVEPEPGPDPAQPSELVPSSEPIRASEPLVAEPPTSGTDPVPVDGGTTPPAPAGRRPAALGRRTGASRR